MTSNRAGRRQHSLPRPDQSLNYPTNSSYVEGGYKERKEGFGLKLKRVFSSIVNKKVAEETDRPHCYVFPPLDQARKEFERYFGVKIDWEKL